MNKILNTVLVTIVGYIILILGSIGLIWGYLLSVSPIKKEILIIKRKFMFSGRLIYWTLNIFFYITFIALIMAYYFFTVWYVMNPEAWKLQGLVPTYLYKK